MRNMRRAMLLFCFLCLTGLSAAAQAGDGKPKQWTYEGSSEERLARAVTIVITEKPNGYEVSGEIKLIGGGLSDVMCLIHGNYIVKKQLVMADCGLGADYTLVTASKMQGQDALNVKLERNKRVTEFTAQRVANRPEKPADIGGSWNSSIKIRYDLSPDGADFTWYLGEIEEHGRITVKGNVLSARWSNPKNSGSATGRVTETDIHGRATRIEWSNGIVFTR